MLCAECHQPIAGLTFVPRTPKVCNRCYVPRSAYEAEQCPYRRRQKPVDSERNSTGMTHSIHYDQREDA